MINVLWLEDNAATLRDFFNLAKQQEVNLILVETAEDAKNMIDLHPEQIDAAILDARGYRTSSSEQAGTGGMHEVRRLLETRQIPFAIFSGEALTINNETYNVEFEYNDFCDTDLLERVDTLMNVIGGTSEGGIGDIKDVFCVVRELLFVGIKSDNKPEDIKAVGKLLDAYRKEKVEGEDRGLKGLFTLLTDELFEEGFLNDLVQMVSEEMNQENEKVVPMEKPKKKATK
jgi:hypothetical protein